MEVEEINTMSKWSTTDLNVIALHIGSASMREHFYSNSGRHHEFGGGRQNLFQTLPRKREGEGKAGTGLGNKKMIVEA